MMVHSSPLQKSQTTAGQVLGSEDNYTSLLSSDSSNNVLVCDQEHALRTDRLKSTEKPLCQQRRLSDEDIALRRGRWSSPSSPVVGRRRDHSTSSSGSNPKVLGSSSLNFQGAPPYSPDKILSPSCNRRTPTLPSQAGHQQRDNVSCPTTPSTSRRYIFPSTSNSFHQHRRLQSLEHPIASDQPKSEGKMVKETCQSSGEPLNLQKPPKEECRHRRLRSTDSQPPKEHITHQPIVKDPTSRQNSNKHGREREDGRPHLPIFPVWIERPNLTLEQTQLPIKEHLPTSKDQAHVSKSMKHHPADYTQRHIQAAPREDQVNTNQSKDNWGNKHANILAQNLTTSLRCMFKKTKTDNRSIPSTPEIKRRVRPTTGDNQRVPQSTAARPPNARLTSSRSMVELSSALSGRGTVPPPGPAYGNSSPTAAPRQAGDAIPGSRGISVVEQMNVAFRLSLQVRNEPLSPPNEAATRSGSIAQNVSSEADSTQLGSLASHPFDDGCDNVPHTECIVCMSSPVNAVIYTCGHMCMCHACAVGIKASQSPKCPMCRAHIKDVIRVYTS